MAAAQGLMAEFQALIEDLPELLGIAAGGKRHVRKVDGHDALVETTVVLGFSRLVVLGTGNVVVAVARAIRREEAAATHAGVDVALARLLALRQFKLAHLLGGDVIGHRALGRALGSKLREVGRASVSGVSSGALRA